MRFKDLATRTGLACAAAGGMLFPLAQMDNGTRAVLLLMHLVAAAALLWSLARRPAQTAVLA